jgi:hypothetical protein
MGLFSLEHGTLAYRADFIPHGGAVTVLTGALLAGAPSRQGLELSALVFGPAWWLVQAWPACASASAGMASTTAAAPRPAAA